MASGVEELLDMLFDMVDEAKNVPLSSDKWTVRWILLTISVRSSLWS